MDPSCSPAPYGDVSESPESQSSRRSVSSNREWTWIQMDLIQKRKKWALRGKKDPSGGPGKAWWHPAWLGRSGDWEKLYEGDIIAVLSCADNWNVRKCKEGLPGGENGESAEAGKHFGKSKQSNVPEMALKSRVTVFFIFMSLEPSRW